MIIDLEHHVSTGGPRPEAPKPTWHPLNPGQPAKKYLSDIAWEADGRLHTTPVFPATSEDSIQFMDEAGIDMAVRTSHARGSREEVRQANDIMAKAVKDYPKRYLGAAAIPIVEGKLDLDEVDRAISGLGLHEVHIMTRPGGLYLDSREMWPFYEKMCKLNVPVDVHIEGEPGFEEVNNPAYALHFTFAREFDMAASVLRVCLGGVLEEFPDLKLQFNHFGGGVSSVLDRLDLYWDKSHRPGCPNWFYKDKPLISKPWRDSFNKLYFNMAGRGVGMDTVKCALTNISPKKLMFATDWPLNYDGEHDKARRYIAEIRKLDLPQEDIDGMLGDNAAKLFGIQE